MAEFAEFVRRGAATVTTQLLQKVHKKLPMLKLQFAQIQAPAFPHLISQLQFLSNLVEDFVDGKADEVPLVTVAAACFAILYAQREWDLIPDPINDIGRMDDSGVVRVVMIENERVLAEYAEKQGINWRSISAEA